MSPTTPTATELQVTLRALLPAGVALDVRAIGLPAPLFPAEESLVSGAVAARRREFAAGRASARAALAHLGCPPAAIGRGPLGEPVWPAGYSGSITHGHRFAAAIAWRTGDSDHGLDLVDEPDLRVLRETAAVYLDPDEHRLLGVDPDGVRAAELFSAKESALKTFSAALGRYVDFLELRLAAAAGGIVVRAPDGTLAHIRSAWTRGVLLTVATTRRG